MKIGKIQLIIYTLKGYAEETHAEEMKNEEIYHEHHEPVV